MNWVRAYSVAYTSTSASVSHLHCAISAADGMNGATVAAMPLLQRVLDNDADFVTPLDMLAELRDDNKQLTANMRETHGLCGEHGDVASASLLENWIDEAERRT